MKRKIFIFLTLLSVLTSCQNKDKGEAPTGFLNFQLVHHDPHTKGEPAQVDETDISDINILLYNPCGLLAYSYYSSNLSENITMAITDNSEFSIYAIANSGDLTSSKSVADEQSICSLQAHFDGPSSLSGTEKGIPMSAKIPLQRYQNGDIVQIELSRLLSKFRVKVDKTHLDPSVKTFDITQVRLRNVNKSVGYFQEGKASSTEDIIPVGECRQGTDILPIYTTGLDFYIPENMQGDLLPENTDQRSHIPPDGYKDLCTYIEFTVQYLSDKLYDEDLIYRYYLHDGRLLDNFDITRNTMYTCLTTFSGEGINEDSWRIDTSSLKKLVTSIEVIPNDLTFTGLGENLPLTAVVLPDDAENNSVSWHSDNPAIATVDKNGTVTSISDGVCTIYATANDGSCVTGKCKITVNSYIYPESIFVSPENINLYIGENALLTATVYPSEANNKSILWSSDDANTATVSPTGEVTAISEGVCKITATTQDKGLTAFATITVTDKSFSLEEIPILYPCYNTPYNIMYHSNPPGTPIFSLARRSGEECLTLEENRLTAFYNGGIRNGEIGRYTLTASMNGKESNRDIVVNIGNISIETAEKLRVGTQSRATVTHLAPSDAGYEWICSNIELATIDSDGTITPLKEGHATIMAKSITGAYSTSNIEILPAIRISANGDRLLNPDNSTTNIEGFPRSIVLTVDCEPSASIEWLVYDSNNQQVAFSDYFEISASNALKAKNNASGRYYLQAKTGDYMSNRIQVDVYLYLEYALSADFNSFDKGKDEVTGDYEILSQWSDLSWKMLNTHPEWVFNFTREPLFRIVMTNSYFGYNYLSGPSNEPEEISGMSQFSFKYNPANEPYPEKSIKDRIAPISHLKNQDGSITSTGTDGIALKMDNSGYFFIRQSPKWLNVTTNWKYE